MVERREARTMNLR